MGENRIIMFSGKFCAPCKTAKPIIESFCHDNGVTLQYHLVEECDDDDLAHYDIQAVPTFVLCKNGVEKIVKGWSSTTLSSITGFFE